MMELPIQLVVLGKGDRKYEEIFQSLNVTEF